MCMYMYSSSEQCLVAVEYRRNPPPPPHVVWLFEAVLSTTQQQNNREQSSNNNSPWKWYAQSQGNAQRMVEAVQYIAIPVKAVQAVKSIGFEDTVILSVIRKKQVQAGTLPDARLF